MDKYSIFDYTWFVKLMKILAGTHILILLIVPWCLTENQIDSLPRKDTYWKKLSPLMPLIFHWSDKTLGILVICNLTKKYDPSLWLIH